MNRDIAVLAKLYGIKDADRLEDELTLCEQGYASLQEALHDEPPTKEGNRILKKLQSLVTAKHPDLAKILQQLEEVERMCVHIRSYPLINGPLVDRILRSDALSDDDLDELRRGVNHIIDQDRARPKGRGAKNDMQDWLIFELAALWTELTERRATYVTFCGRGGDFLDFARLAAEIIGLDERTRRSLPERFVKVKRVIKEAAERDQVTDL
jgi:hypothetical protein